MFYSFQDILQTCFVLLDAGGSSGIEYQSSLQSDKAANSLSRSLSSTGRIRACFFTFLVLGSLHSLIMFFYTLFFGCRGNIRWGWWCFFFASFFRRLSSNFFAHPLAKDSFVSLSTPDVSLVEVPILLLPLLTQHPLLVPYFPSFLISDT